jgi:hypothetical protein
MSTERESGKPSEVETAVRMKNNVSDADKRGTMRVVSS